MITALNFLFLLIYIIMKYHIVIKYMEEEIISEMTEIKIYSDRNLEFCYVNKFQTNSIFKLVYLGF